MPFFGKKKSLATRDALSRGDRVGVARKAGERVTARRSGDAEGLRTLPLSDAGFTTTQAGGRWNRHRLTRHFESTLIHRYSASSSLGEKGSCDPELGSAKEPKTRPPRLFPRPWHYVDLRICQP